MNYARVEVEKNLKNVTEGKEYMINEHSVA